MIMNFIKNKMNVKKIKKKKTFLFFFLNSIHLAIVIETIYI